MLISEADCFYTIGDYSLILQLLIAAGWQVDFCLNGNGGSELRFIHSRTQQRVICRNMEGVRVLYRLLNYSPVQD